MTLEKKRQQRCKQTAEVFTPADFVNEILDKLPEESLYPGKTVCDPACGNGNMLIEVLKFKLNKGHDPLQSLGDIYGADIMQDNIQECRIRLLQCLDSISEESIRIVSTNIVLVSLENHPEGSLNYDFSFEQCEPDKSISAWLDFFNNGVGKESDLPVSCAKKNTISDLETDIFDI